MLAPKNNDLRSTVHASTAAVELYYSLLYIDIKIKCDNLSTDWAGVGNVFVGHLAWICVCACISIWVKQRETWLVLFWLSWHGLARYCNAFVFSVSSVFSLLHTVTVYNILYTISFQWGLNLSEQDNLENNKNLNQNRVNAVIAKYFCVDIFRIFRHYLIEWKQI